MLRMSLKTCMSQISEDQTKVITKDSAFSSLPHSSRLVSSNKYVHDQEKSYVFSAAFGSRK